METTSKAFAGFFSVIQRLRAPDGCPWDIEQTPATMRANLIEEAYECVEAINEADPAHVCEELGDVFLLAGMISYMYEQAGAFKVSEVLEGITAKLIRRHPHVFGESDAATAEEVLKQWNDIKVHVEGRKQKDSVLDDVSKALPPLDRAYRMQKKAAKKGFDWPDIAPVWAKLQEEIAETRNALAVGGHDQLEDELGDVLFSVVNLSRFIGVEPSVALQRANSKFERRFRHVERSMKTAGLDMDASQFETMDRLWDEAKSYE